MKKCLVRCPQYNNDAVCASERRGWGTDRSGLAWDPTQPSRATRDRAKPTHRFVAGKIHECYVLPFFVAGRTHSSALAITPRIFTRNWLSTSVLPGQLGSIMPSIVHYLALMSDRQRDTLIKVWYDSSPASSSFSRSAKLIKIFIIPIESRWSYRRGDSLPIVERYTDATYVPAFDFNYETYRKTVFERINLDAAQKFSLATGVNIYFVISSNLF